MKLNSEINSGEVLHKVFFDQSCHTCYMRGHTCTTHISISIVVQRREDIQGAVTSGSTDHLLLPADKIIGASEMDGLAIVLLKIILLSWEPALELPHGVFEIKTEMGSFSIAVAHSRLILPHYCRPKLLLLMMKHCLSENGIYPRWIKTCNLPVDPDLWNHLPFPRPTDTLFVLLPFSKSASAGRFTGNKLTVITLPHLPSRPFTSNMLIIIIIDEIAEMESSTVEVSDQTTIWFSTKKVLMTISKILLSPQVD